MAGKSGVTTASQLTGIGQILGISRDRLRNLERDGLADLRQLSEAVEA